MTSFTRKTPLPPTNNWKQFNNFLAYRMEIMPTINGNLKLSSWLISLYYIHMIHCFSRYSHRILWNICKTICCQFTSSSNPSASMGVMFVRISSWISKKLISLGTCITNGPPNLMNQYMKDSSCENELKLLIYYQCNNNIK